MKIGYKNLKILAVLYAFVPVVIFYIGWLSIVSAIILAALSAASMFFFIKNSSHRDGKAKSIILSKTQIIIIAAIAFVWCLLAGQGGFVHQSADHVARNTIFKNIISYDWPVTFDNGNTLMCYYIAHWIVPALFGKIALFISGSTRFAYIVGNIALLLWSSFGCFIVFLLVAMITNTGKRKRVFIAILMFMFFSGLDIIGILYNKKLSFINNSMHLEWWANWCFQYSSNMTCLYWVFNQVIVPWILVLLIMNEKKLKNIAMYGILSAPFGPLPMIGIIILCALKTVSAFCVAVKSKKIGEFFRDLFSVQNVLAMLAVAPVYLLYYSSNAIVEISSSTSAAANAANAAKTVDAGDAGGRLRTLNEVKSLFSGSFTADDRKFLIVYFMFVILEAWIYIALILKRKKPDIVLIGMGVSLLFIPLVRIGFSSDISMRVSVPGLIYICITFIHVIMAELPEWGEYGTFNNCMRHKKYLIVALIVFMIGTFTPATEIKREVLSTISTPYSEIMKHFDESGPVSGGNFLAKNYKKSNFYKYFCKKSD